MEFKKSFKAHRDLQAAFLKSSSREERKRYWVKEKMMRTWARQLGKNAADTIDKITLEGMK